MGFVHEPWELFSDDPAIFSRGVCEMLRREEKRKLIMSVIQITLIHILFSALIIIFMGGL